MGRASGRPSTATARGSVCPSWRPSVSGSRSTTRRAAEAASGCSFARPSRFPVNVTEATAFEATEDATEIAVTPGPLVGPVLRRVVGMLAARADLPLDKLDDAVLVADIVAQRAGP